MRTIKAKHKAVYEPIGDLVTYRALPTHTVTINQIDPFILLNHHGRQEYLPKNSGLPFGPHPHRGFETVTFILEGDLTHKDSSGGSSNIKAGGVQWMTAGSGLIHAEISSEEFKLKGGPVEILQLWINLPARHKMAEPRYIGLQKADVPTVSWDDSKVVAHIVSGTWENITGPVKPFTDINLSWIEFKEGGKHSFKVDAGKNIFCYIAGGAIKINGEEVHQHYLVEFNTDGTTVEMKATTDAVLLFGYATPIKETIIAYGPFVMNTAEEIHKAYEDYRQGNLGSEAIF